MEDERPHIDITITTNHKKKNFGSPKVYLTRIAKSIGARLSSTVLSQLGDCVRRMGQMVAIEAYNACKIAKNKKTITTKEIQAAVRAVFTDRGWIEKEALTAVSMFNETPSQASSPSNRRETKAGLVFSVSLAEKYIRVFCNNVSKTSPVYLSASIECVFREIITAASNKAGENVIIKPRHVFLGVVDSEKLKSVFHDLGLSLMKGGHQQTIFHSPKNKNAENAVILHQESVGLLLQKKPFHRFVKIAYSNVTRNTYNRIGFGVYECLQAFVEDTTVGVLSDARLLAQHASRDGVGCLDFVLAWKLNRIISKTIKYTVKSIPFTEIGCDGIERLSQRAGITRKRKDLYDITKTFMFITIEEVLKRCVDITESLGVCTIHTPHLKYAIESMGLFYALAVPKKK